MDDYPIRSIGTGPDRLAEWVEGQSTILLDRGIWTNEFEPWSNQTNNLTSYTCCFLAKHSTLKLGKDWCQNNVIESWFRVEQHYGVANQCTLSQVSALSWCNLRCCQNVKKTKQNKTHILQQSTKATITNHRTLCIHNTHHINYQQR